MKYVSPSVRETAFNCPHCGTLTTQFWYSLHAKNARGDKPLPIVIPADDERKFDFLDVEDRTEREHLVDFFRKLKLGRPFFDKSGDAIYAHPALQNVNVSTCYNCKEISIWIYDKLVYPVRGEAPPANPDLPPDIRDDYDEASAILDLSPRGAAALMRLCIQKLCIYLDQPGKNLNDDIAALVRAGLDVRVQRALDAVRVIGNSAVHPGKIDLKDDRSTAESLFRLLNLIAEKMISEPKHVDDVYDKLPPSVKAQIAARDKQEEKT